MGAGSDVDFNVGRSVNLQFPTRDLRGQVAKVITSGSFGSLRFGQI